MPRASCAPVLTGQAAEASVRLFAMAFGFGWHAIVHEVAKWAGAFKDGDKDK